LLDRISTILYSVPSTEKAMSSRAKNRQTPKRKPIDWKNVAFIIFGLVMVFAMIISAFSKY